MTRLRLTRSSPLQGAHLDSVVRVAQVAAQASAAAAGAAAAMVTHPLPLLPLPLARRSAQAVASLLLGAGLRQGLRPSYGCLEASYWAWCTAAAAALGLIS